MIRPATPDDAEAIAGIYAPVVEQTAISFEEVAPTLAEMRGRIEALLPRYPYLVAERGGAVIGYAYAGPHRPRAAYRYSADVTLYVSQAARRTGVGRALYAHLLPDLGKRGLHRAYAGITLPNAGSIALHEAMGFAHVGTYREVGFKFGKWHDVGRWECALDRYP
ncbi:MAG: GNAT family N-acetyltransferase [Sulfitobacter sp.]|nr:GNAT family N-acetyltransferase [Sulfitobacter sp.]